MKDREDFLKRIQNIKVEKEPKIHGFELTKENAEKQLEEYNKVLKSEIYKATIMER